MVGAMDPYRGSLHCICTLIVPLLTQTCKWVLVTKQWGQGAMVGGMVQNSQSLYLFTFNALLSFTNIFIHIQQLNLHSRTILIHI